MAEDESKAKYFKEKGNEAMNGANYMEAVLNYTFAIKHDGQSAEIYSNRSLGFLKQGQLYYALEDADHAIKLSPKWPKGYYRKAEVFIAAKRYKEAIDFYQKALELQPGDSALIECVSKARKACQAAELLELQTPWLGTAIGLVLGMLAVVLEYFLSKNKYLQHPFLQLLVIVLLAVTAYGIACMYRKFTKIMQSKLLEKPFDILDHLN